MPRRGRPHSQDAPPRPLWVRPCSSCPKLPHPEHTLPEAAGTRPRGRPRSPSLPRPGPPTQLEGPYVNQSRSPPRAAGGTHPPSLVVSLVVIPNTPSLISFFLPSLLNHSFIHFFQKAPQSQAQAQAQAGLRGGRGLPRPREPTVGGAEARTSAGPEHTGRGAGEPYPGQTQRRRQGGLPGGLPGTHQFPPVWGERGVEGRGVQAEQTCVKSRSKREPGRCGEWQAVGSGKGRRGR